MNVRRLQAVVAALGIGELVTMVIELAEKTPNSEPVLLGLFALPWLGAWALLRTGRQLSGGIAATLLSLFILASFPTWRHYSVLERTWQVAYVLVALVGAVLGIGVVVRRAAQARTS